MEIKINGKATDIILDNEKTVGEVMAGFEQWLSNSGHRLSGLSIDGTLADSSALEEIFKREINTIKNLDIYTSTITELAAESLLNLLSCINEYKSLNLQGKNNFLEDWKERAEAKFICEAIPDLYEIYTGLFSGQADTETVYSITEERLREIKDPVKEFLNLKPLVDETCNRLSDFALDIQTGKDGRAAQSIKIFSSVAEKIFRILRQLDIQGYLSKDGEKSINQIIGEFGNLTGELLEAYKKNDTILVGDMAEYEVSVKLKELVTAIMNTASAQVEK